jgi:type I site-specific restriction endonuclease
MNEAETTAELIDPKLKENGWGVTEGCNNPKGRVPRALPVGIYLG